MSFTVLVGEQPREFLEEADEKTERIVKDNLASPAEDPFPRPGSGRGDREKLVVEGREIYRYHIGRTFTAFYTIHGDDNVVRVREILPMGDAHKRYGY